MKSTKIFLILGVLAVLVLPAVQEIRFQRALNQLRAERVSETAGDTTATPAAAEDAQEAVRQMSRARAELAAAQQRLATATSQIQQLQSQVAALAQQVQGGPGSRLGMGSRSRSGFRTSETTEFEPLTDPTQPPRRSWGQEQATGAPDTFSAGDHSSAWAPMQQDGGEEWLHLDYSNHVQLAEVRVRETYNPGAISKVAAVLPNGQEVTIWEGVDEPGVAPLEKAFSVSGNLTAKSVKVYLDTKRVPGWNEIDAVELVGRDGSRQWAAHASASSSYADPR